MWFARPECRHAFQMHGERHADRLDLVPLEEVESIGPVLHHAATLLHVLGMYVALTLFGSTCESCAFTQTFG